MEGEGCAERVPRRHGSELGAMHCSMYVCARGAVCVERAELNGAAAWCCAGAYGVVGGLVDHPLPGCSGLASRDSEDSAAPPSTIAAPWLIFVLVTAHRAWLVAP